MERRLPWPIESVLPNPYDAALFRPDTNRRTCDVVFVGRLIREKGAHILIEALGILHRAGRAVNAAIIGGGPERAHLEELARERSVHARIDFAGEMTVGSLAQRLNEHRILVIPSMDEAFGIVALEGAACGCAVIASDAGGLPEAVGPCGCLFPAGDGRHHSCHAPHRGWPATTRASPRRLFLL
jgi:glycosyltransferase involved in cell wall biosynthesis